MTDLSQGPNIGGATGRLADDGGVRGGPDEDELHD